KRGEKRGDKRDRKRRDGRKSERGDRRRRDPRAIDIVPRAPTPEESEREKVLLVNAGDREEARIALLVDGVLEEVYIETASVERSSAGNIYRGRVQNVERGIGAAFVDLGRGVTGFLHASDLPVKEDEEPSADVTERLHAGDEVIVQITRDSIGRKGPALTGRISFAGRYLVLMPFTARSGISRRIPQGRERDRVRKLLRKLEVPEGMGVIVRTASETTDLAALEADLGHLLKEWEFIKRKAAEPGQPGVLRGESDLAERSVRDIMPSDVTRIVVDRDDIAGRIHRLLRVWYPSAAAAADEAAHVAVRSATRALDTPLGEIEDAPAEPEAEEEREGEEAADDAPVAETEAVPEDDALDDEAPSDPDADADVDAEEVQEEASDADEEETEEAEEVEDADETEDAEDDEGEDEESEPEETEAERLQRLTKMARAMPEVELHTDALPLFHKYGAETQLEDAFRRSMRLPSGGSIVIDQTEALVAVDVNSGRLTDESDPESTALVTNLEAVEETARQLRLRDLGGLVVIDFIDMRDRKSRKKVETALKEALSGDRARIRMGRMGPFGLVVLSRQRIRQALSRVTHDPCQDCGGTGYRRQISGLGLRVLREMRARVARSRGRGGLGVRAPQEVVTWIKKNRSGVLKQLKKACNGPIVLEADARLAVDGWAMKGLPPEGAGEKAE
nr:ribonuclease E/G [Planctomycetota bacterium]